MFPIEVDFDLVRRQRREGILRMGQPHKSFRDNKVEFPVYRPDFDRTYLNSLGPLEKAKRPPSAPTAAEPAIPEAGKLQAI